MTRDEISPAAKIASLTGAAEAASMISYIVIVREGEMVVEAKDDLTVRHWAVRAPSVLEVRRGRTIVYRRVPDRPRREPLSEPTSK
jgi:hypothetical protein